MTPSFVAGCPDYCPFAIVNAPPPPLMFRAEVITGELSIKRVVNTPSPTLCRYYRYSWHANYIGTLSEKECNQFSIRQGGRGGATALHSYKIKSRPNLSWCWFIVGPPSTTLTQHQSNTWFIVSCLLWLPWFKAVYLYTKYRTRAFYKEPLPYPCNVEIFLYKPWRLKGFFLSRQKYLS